MTKAERRAITTQILALDECLQELLCDCTECLLEREAQLRKLRELTERLLEAGAA